MVGCDRSTNLVLSVQEKGGFDYNEINNHHHHRSNQFNNLSRLSICASYDVKDCDELDLSMSRISLEDGNEADEEQSDGDRPTEKTAVAGERLLDLGSSDSDKEHGCYSLPATPPRRRRRNFSVNGGGSSGNKPMDAGKAYASENEAQKSNRANWWRQRRGRRARYIGGGGGGGDGGGGAVVVISRAKGGGKAMRMDLEEVKACRDLGFELEHQKMVEVPGWVSVSGGSTLDTSSGGNSPISGRRISSPGDDPKEVKARLKVWAQVVALTSTSRSMLPDS